MFDSELMMIF